jgi:hypothetical protein
MARLLGSEFSFDGGLEKTWLHTGDDGKDRITVERVVDVDPVLKRNAEEFNSQSGGFMRGDMHKVASIPAIVMEQMARKHQIPFAELIAGKSEKARFVWSELLNGREFRAFRTKPGRIDTSRGIR